MPHYRLTYFNGMGRAELIRWVFAVTGQEYEDIRVERDDPAEWPASLQDKTPFGQLPYIEIDGQMFCQSNVIARYIAVQNNLGGKDDLEQLRCDMIVGCMEDTVKPLIVMYFEEDKVRWQQQKEKFDNIELPFFLKYWERLLKENRGGDGYFVGDSMTWADLAVLNGLGWVEDVNMDPYPKLAAFKERVESHPKLQEWFKIRPVTDW